MDAVKHALLRTLGPRVFSTFHAHAVAQKVTIDDLVRAGLRRGVASSDAKKASLGVERTLPGIFEKLEAWPHVCVFCLGEATECAMCPFCHAVGCAGCVAEKGCPKCRNAQDERVHALQKAVAALGGRAATGTRTIG